MLQSKSPIFQKVENYIMATIPEIEKIEAVESYKDKHGILVDSGLLFITKDGNKFLLHHNEDSENIDIITLHADEKGTGLGTKIISAMKDYSDVTMKFIVVHKSRNDSFYLDRGFKDTFKINYHPSFRKPTEDTEKLLSRLKIVCKASGGVFKQGECILPLTKGS